MKKLNWKKILMIFIGSGFLFVGLVTVSYWVFSDAINTSIRNAVMQYVRTRVSSSASSASNGKVEIELGSIDYKYYIGTLEIRNIRLRYRDTATHEGRLVDIDVPLVRTTGIFPWDVLLGDGLSLNSITLTNPEVRHQKWGGALVDSVVIPDTALVTLPHIPNVDSILHDLMVNILPTYTQPIHIKEIGIVDLTFTNADVDPGSMYSGVMNGLTIYLRDISVDSLKPSIRPIGRFDLRLEKWKRNYSDDRMVFVKGLTIHVSDSDSLLVVDSVAYHHPNAYTYVASNVVFSYRTKELTIGQFDLGPTKDDIAYFDSQKYNNDRFRISGTGLLLRDIDFTALTERTALHVKTVYLAKLDLDIASNKRLRSDPKSLRPMMPNAIVATIPFKLSIDSIMVDSASILYGERWAHSVKPAELSWSGVKMVATNLRNTKDQLEHPFNVWARGSFLNQSMMEASFTLPLTSADYILRATGSLKRFNITALNRFLPIADNVRIKSGVCSSASFEFTIHNRRCRGIVEPHFTDLDLALVDKKTKKTGFFDGIISFVANWLVVKNDNDGEDYAPGRIRYTLPKDAAIMQTVWFPIRYGIKTAAGL